MSPIPLSFASALYDRMVPLATSEVTPTGLSVNFLEIHHPRDIFDRASSTQDFDASELSASEYITTFSAQGAASPFLAIPVFPSRCFRHSFIAVNKSRIKTPKDLEGKRVGVQLYTMTAAVWQRGLLQDEYGVDLSSITWVEGKMEGPGSHGSPSSIRPGKKVKIEKNEDTDRSLSDLLRDGEIDATIGADLPACLNTGDIGRLFPDFHHVEREYYLRTGIFPIMHLVAMKRGFVDRNPWAPTSLFEALDRAKELARKRMEFTGALRYMLPWLPEALEEVKEVFGGDCWPYGVEPNRKTLEALVRYLFEQGMIDREVDVDELFVKVRPANFRIE